MTMTKCCIKGCNADSRKHNQNMSFFSFPKNEASRKIWIDTIGSENIKPLAVIKICSSHFEKDCVNNTLQRTRLKDDVVPSLFPFQQKKTETNETNRSINPIKLEEFPSASACDVLSVNTGQSTVVIKTEINEIDPLQLESVNTGENTVLIKTETNEIDPLQLESVNTGESNVLMKTKTNEINPIQLKKISSPSTCDVLSLNTRKKVVIPKTIQRTQKLECKVQIQQKKIKVLNQKCRRLTQKVHTLQYIINDLKKRNYVPHEECAGSPEFLSRQISKHKGEACPQSIEEVRAYIKFFVAQGLPVCQTHT